MPRVKKSRKIGKIGISKDNSVLPSKTNNKHKNRKGKKPGTRQADKPAKTQDYTKVEKKDPRTGSKTKVDLSKYKPGVSKTSNAANEPHDELRSIENDQRLEHLLTQSEQRELTTEEQHYVDEKLDRHQTLCELLGLSEDDDKESDPFLHLDAIRKEDFDE